MTITPGMRVRWATSEELEVEVTGVVESIAGATAVVAVEGEAREVFGRYLHCNVHSLSEVEAKDA